MKTIEIKGITFILKNVQSFNMSLSENICTDLESKSPGIAKAGPITEDLSEFDWPKLSEYQMRNCPRIYLEVNDKKISFGIPSKSAYSQCKLEYDHLKAMTERL